MQLRHFVVNDWVWVQEWFKDAQLDLELGPLDQAWLDAVSALHDGIQLVALEGQEPVALIGCVWNQNPKGLHVITDIAVCPDYRNQGIGRRALLNTMQWPGHPPSGGWVAFVSQRNAGAQAFFSSLGWANAGLDDGMCRFEFAQRDLLGAAPFKVYDWLDANRKW